MAGNKQKKPRWGRTKWFATAILSSVISFIAGTVIGQSLLASLWPGPKATVTVQGLKKGECTAYNFDLTHTGTIDSASFKLRFPYRLETAKMGIPENIGVPAKNFLIPFVTDPNMDTCTFNAGGNDVNTSSSAFSVTGNTLWVSSGKLSPTSSLMGSVLATNQISTMHPAPTKIEIEGDYTYNLFGMTIVKPLASEDGGVTDTDAKTNKK
jgi:hypothetical protein